MSQLTGEEEVARAHRARGSALDPRLRGDDALWVAQPPLVIPAQAGIQQPAHFAIPTATIQPFKFTEAGYWCHHRRATPPLRGTIPLGTEDAVFMGRLGCEGARRKAQQYHLVLRAFATLQTHCPNGPGTPHLQFRGV
jgi:hypothetical protein